MRLLMLGRCKRTSSNKIVSESYSCEDPAGPGHTYSKAVHMGEAQLRP